MKNRYLSSEEKEFGVLQYLKHLSYNGMGITFLGETTVYLMAIYFGASNLQLGYISSAIHWSGVILVFVPQLLAGMNLIQIQYFSWMVRGSICLLYLTLFFSQGQNAVWLILVIYTIFCLVRMVGVSVAKPVQQMLTSPSNVGQTIVRFSNRFHMARLASNFLSFAVLSTKFIGTLPGLLIIQGMGILTNVIASYYLKQIPCRETVDYKKGRNIFKLFWESLKNREVATVLFLHWLSLGTMILTSFIVPFLKILLEMPESLVFLYTIVVSLATLVSGYLLKPFADKMGSKPIMTLSAYSLAALSLTWAFLPLDIHWGFIYVLGFFTMFFQGMVLLLAMRLFLKAIPENDRVTFSSMVYFFSAILALGIGLGGGLLIDLGESLEIAHMNAYGPVFLTIFGMSIGINTFCFLLKDEGSITVWETAQVLLSTRNLKAYLDIYQYQMTQDPLKKRAIVMSISSSDTPVATEEIRKVLKNPLSSAKGELLKTLFLHPRPELLPDLLQEAQDPHSYHRIKAIFALGAYPGEEVEKALISFLDDPMSSIRSTAAKSLGRVGNDSELERIVELAKVPSKRQMDHMNYLIAILLMDHERRYLNNFFGMVNRNPEASHMQPMFSICSKVLEMVPPLADLYQKENTEPTGGLVQLLLEAKQSELFRKDAEHLKTLYETEAFAKIWKWCCRAIEGQSTEGNHRWLQHSLMHQKEEDLNATNTLATLYFTHQILA